MQKILVVYFSRSGNTAKLASQLAEKLNADVSPILEPRQRNGFMGFMRSIFEAITGRRPLIRPPEIQPAGYELVAVGTPVWAGHVSSPVRSYLGNYGPHCKRLAFFCTMGGSGAEKVFAEMAQLSGAKPLATLAVSDKQLNAGAHSQDIKLIAYEIQRALTQSSIPEGEEIETVPRRR